MNLKVGPYQLRHSSALDEWISRWRTSEEIMKRGRATRSTIRASLEYGRFSLVIRQHCESCERLPEAAFLGKVNTRWPPRQQPYKALLRPTVSLGIVSKAVFKGGLQTVERTNSCEQRRRHKRELHLGSCVGVTLSPSADADVFCSQMQHFKVSTVWTTRSTQASSLHVFLSVSHGAHCHRLVSGEDHDA